MCACCEVVTTFHLLKNWRLFTSAKQLGKRASRVIFSVSISSVALHDPGDYGTPGLLAHHQLAEFIQTHVH